METSTTWDLIHSERAATADLLDDLSPSEWAERSLCAGWSVQLMAAHIVAGAEQTPPNFVRRLAASGFRFNTMIDRDAHRIGTTPPAELIERLRARIDTTNGPPAPTMAMLGEIVVHSEDIRRPLGRSGNTAPEAVAACLSMYAKANFPVGSKKRIAGLRLTATDLDWTFGSGAEVRGPGLGLLMAITGRSAGASELAGEGADSLRSRMHAPA